MLSLGLTGGIASGKSLLSARLAYLGAIVIDADKLARQVVEPGTPALAEIVETFGPEMLLPDGTLNRPALGAMAFSDKNAREQLNAITHPRVRAEAGRMAEQAGPGEIVVQDIPLLVETGQGDAFHLVLVVDAPVEAQLERMTSLRGMDPDDARARIHAQATREQRLAAADVVIDNSGTAETALAQLDSLWHDRLVPFAGHLARAESAPYAGPARLVPPDANWAAQAQRLARRIRHVGGGLVLAVDHIGSTSVPGLVAKDVLDLQLRVRSMDDAGILAPVLAKAGFPLVPGEWRDNPHPGFGEDAPGPWPKRLHGASDPGRLVNLHVRVEGSAGATFALALRDWLSADVAARGDYLALKQSLADVHSGDASTSGYAEAKETWFSAAAPKVVAWMEQTRWSYPAVPPSSSSSS